MYVLPQSAVFLKENTAVKSAVMSNKENQEHLTVSFQIGQKSKITFTLFRLVVFA